MKILVAGGRNKAQNLASIIEGMEAIGVDLHWVRTRYRKQESVEPQQVVAERVVLAAVEEFKPDILLWWNPKGDYPLGLMHKVHNIRPGVITVYHTLDDPFVMETGSSVRWMDFDRAITCCEASIEYYEAEGIPAACLYPPARPAYLAQGPVEPQCDLSFLITNVYPPAEYPHVLADRCDIVRAVRELGTVDLYGYKDSPHGWCGPHGDPSFEDLYKGWLDHLEIPPVVAGSRINLNSHVRPDGYKYLNERVIQILGSGGFQLVDRVAGIEEIFTPGLELDTWATIDELVEKAKYYLTHDEIRRRIAQKGRERAAKDFSAPEFARKVVELCICRT